jgi:hypothetical protein
MGGALRVLRIDMIDQNSSLYLLFSPNRDHWP